MPEELGGRADKAGNRYEIKCIIYELLNLINEKSYSVVIEALGEDEVGTDILITDIEGKKEHQQCKVRNASKEYWGMSDLKSRNIIRNWNYQLNRGDKRQVALVSPIGCSYFVDLHDRALNTSGEARDFYEIQIKKSSKDFCKFYNEFCTAMNLELSKDNDILRSIDFLSRINIKQMSEYAIKESIYQNIEFYFSTDKNIVYNSLVTFIIDGEILGKEITEEILLDYLSEQNIKLRLIDRDKRIMPQINLINKEYRSGFKSLKEGLIHRGEFDKCIDVIKNECSLIITGGAGYGKSGCAEAVLNFCQSEKIPYIAIKLDRKIPKRNCEYWGQELGFPSSIAYALHVVSKNKQAVILLDQLDALRWTQANSSEALSVCMELIRQVKFLNYEREHRIAIVFVCRTYDLHNDNNIKLLFKTESDINKEEQEWRTVLVQNFDEKIVKRVVGEKYKKLTKKTRELLQVPSNLYIWQHLDEEESYDDCITTSHLIEKWYQQICKKSISVGVQERVVVETQEKIVSVLDRIGHLYAPKGILNVEETGFDYLKSLEMIVVDGSRVGFVHQSILDYFISKRMMNQYFDGKEMEEIIGEKHKQTPSKRYQIQMFLQNILEFDSSMFLTAGKKMYESDGVRYYVKSVFYEILGQILQPDENIKDFILEGCKDDTKVEFLLENVIYGNYSYISIIRDCGILEEWFGDKKKKNLVFAIFRSISPNLDSRDIKFIKEHSFEDEDDDRQFRGCFGYDIMKDSDELFELRMLFYHKYPEWSQELYINMNIMIKKCEIRIIRLLSFWLKNKISSERESIYRYEEELLNEKDSFFVKNGQYVIDELLQYVPKDNSESMIYSDWSARYMYSCGLERATIGLIKKANRAIINKNPDLFWNYYEPYMGKNYTIYNEIILDGLRFLPESYSNKIITYLSNDLDKKIFDYTSGAEEPLGLVKEVIRVHSSFCDVAYLSSFENTVIKYISPNASEWYKCRIERNKTKEDEPVYWSFWGDMQYQLLKNVSNERLSEQSKNLLRVLERKFEGKTYHYVNGNMYSGGVSSPVSGKRIGKKQWLQIITNKKLKDRNNINWKEEKGEFIESSLEMYSGDFQSAVRIETEPMIKLVLDNREDVVPIFIESLYLGAELSEHIDEVSQQTWEEMFRNLPCDMESNSASYFCGILEKAKIYTWSAEILEKLKDIALYYRGTIEKEDTKEDTLLSCKEVVSRTLNCVRGSAARTIGHLLWENRELFIEFIEVIDNLTLDDNPTVKMSSLFALWPSYNINKEWAETRILRLYESDVRMAGFHDSKGMFHRLYPKYKERVLAIITKCFNSEDEELIETGGASLCEFFIRYDEFTDIISKIEEMSEEQVKAILHMAVIYLKYEEYRDKAKDIIIMYRNLESDFEFPLAGMFYDKLVDVERDSKFLLELMRSKVSKRMVYSFVVFLEENALSVKSYAEIVLTLCESVLAMDSESIKKQWGIEDEISKLIIVLYDECANSENLSDKRIAERCLDVWDVMFEKQIGQVRVLSSKLMER